MDTKITPMKTSFFLLNSLFVLLLLSCSSQDQEANAAKETKVNKQLKLSSKQLHTLGIEMGSLQQINMGLST